jgi:hypothetical protein
MAFFVVLLVAGWAHARPAGEAGARSSAGDYTTKATFGMLYITGQDHEWTGGPERIDSLDEEPSSGTKVLPVIMLEVAYKGPEGGPEYYAGNPLSEYGKLGLGVRGPAGPGKLDLFAYATLSKEIWRNPYLVGVDRRETPAREYGARAGYGHINDVPLTLEYEVEYFDVDIDSLGRSEPALARDGVKHKVELKWAERFEMGLELEPAAVYERGDYEGGAASYTGRGLALGVKYKSRALIVDAFVGGGEREYDEVHPLFSKKRKDSVRGLYLMAIRPGAFGRDDLSIIAGAALFRTDSNIKFHDSGKDFLFAGVGYEF